MNIFLKIPDLGMISLDNVQMRPSYILKIFLLNSGVCPLVASLFDFFCEMFSRVK